MLEIFPYQRGKFDLDDFIDYLLSMIKILSPNLNVMAVCQPCVPLLAALSLIDDSDIMPSNVILMGGPVDTRISPTLINQGIKLYSVDNIKQMVIQSVSNKYKGYNRDVYPGYIQLANFMIMNPSLHFMEHYKYFLNAVMQKSNQRHKKFYNEYFATMDLTAEFFLQTIETVFHNHSLPKGEMCSRNRKIDLSKIRNTRILVTEGENDDITGVGQTKAALELCSSIPDFNKEYVLQKNVGHYGIFSGRNFNQNVLPKIIKFIMHQNKIRNNVIHLNYKE